MAIEIKTDPGSTSNEKIHQVVHGGGKRFAMAVALLFAGLTVYSLWHFAWRSALVALAGVALMPFLIPLAWTVGNMVRQAAAPEAIVSSGMKDTLKQRAFWLFGPQLIACAIIGIPPVLAWTLVLNADQRASEDRAAQRQREAEQDRLRTLIAERSEARAEALSHFQKLDDDGERGFRDRVVATGNRLGLPLGPCMAETLLGMTCEEAGLPLDPTLGKIGLVPMRIGLASRMPEDVELEAMLRACFPRVAGMAAGLHPNGVALPAPCEDGAGTPGISGSVSAAMRNLMFQTKHIERSPANDLAWDWIVGANGLGPVIRSLGPYPFSEPAEAFLLAWQAVGALASEPGASAKPFPPQARFSAGAKQSPTVNW